MSNQPAFGMEFVNATIAVPVDIQYSEATVNVQLTGSNASFSWETTASTAEETNTANVKQWFTFANDDPTNSIQINFDATVGSAGTMTVHPGDIINGMPRAFNVLHVKAVAGTPAFRAWGV